MSQWIKDNSATNPGGAFGAPPDIENALGYVLTAETLLGDIALNYIPASTGSLVTITFNVTAAPGPGQTLSSIMQFSPPGSQQSSIVDDINGNDEPGLTFGTFTYSLIYASTTPPGIQDPTQVPPMNNVNVSQSVVVSTNVTDNSGTGLKNVTLSYSTDNVTFTSTAMTLNATTGLWGGTIPGYATGTTVYYNILAYDNAGNHAINSNVGNWNYHVIPEFTSILIIVMLFAMASAVLLMRKKIVS
jgi:hypothetical protein